MKFQCFDERKCINIIILKILTLGLYFIVLHFSHQSTLQWPNTCVSTPYESLFLLFVNFSLLFSDLLCMCACVYIHFYACKMIACSMQYDCVCGIEVRSRIGGQLNDSLRNTGGGAKLKRYVSLHRGRGSKLSQIGITQFLDGPLP